MAENNQFTDVLWMSRYHYGNKSMVSAHKHDFYQIIYFIEGEGVLHVGGEQTRLEFPLVAFLQPDQMHGIEITKSLKTIDIKFQVTSEEFASKLAPLPSLIHNLDTFDTLFFLECMLAIGGDERLYYRERCQFLLNLILMQWLELPTETTLKDQPFKVYPDSSSPTSRIGSELLEFIENNLNKNLEGQTLSDELGYSYRYISACCLKEYSMTPMQLVRTKRIERAKELLLRDDYEIKEIAFDLGFKSMYHFSRVFKSLVGKPPGKWRDFQLRKICRDIIINPKYINELYIQDLE